MSVTHIVGIDPGLVHTGVIELVFVPEHRRVHVCHDVVAGPNVQAVQDFITRPVVDSELWGGGLPRIFVERYQPRNTMGTDVRMVEAQARFRAALPDAEFILNTGVKKVVRKHLMELLQVWKFSTVTNHQDLRSAARIALYGMLKDETLNRLLADAVRDHLSGETWDVRHTG